MKHYDDVATAPLKFHKLYKYIMPLIGANALANLILGIRLNGFAGTGVMIDYVYDALVVVFVVLGVYGSLYWKPVGWYGVMSLQSVQVLYAVVVYVMLQVTNNMPDKMLEQMALKVILPVLIFIYYLKRKDIFFNTVVTKVSRQAVKRSSLDEDDEYDELEEDYDDEYDEEFDESHDDEADDDELTVVDVECEECKDDEIEEVEEVKETEE